MARGDVGRRKRRQGHSRLITNLKFLKADYNCNKMVNIKKIQKRKKNRALSPHCYTLIENDRKYVEKVKNCDS